MKKDLKEFKTFPSSTIKEIQRAANEGIYQIRGLGAKRKVPDFDDLVFLGASMSDRKSTRLNSSHMSESRMPSSA